MLCELAVGLSSLVLLPVLAVGAFFLVKVMSLGYY